MTDAILLAGGGDFTDPWHPFAETAACIADELGGLGVRTTIVDTAARFAAVLAAGTGLAVVQASNDFAPTDVDGTVIEAVAAHLACGRPLLAVHSAACAFVDRPEWERMLGGRWVQGVTSHPELGPATVRLAPHPITEGLADIEVVDERYTALRVSPEVEPLAWHEEAGERHTLAWAHRVGDARVVFDALGHDARSYESPTRRALLAAEARWLLAG